MSSMNPTTSFASFSEDISLNNLTESNSENEQSSGAIRRSQTDAHLFNYRPQIRVHFNSLAAGINKQLSDGGVELLSAKAHQIGLAATRSGGWQNTILNRRRQSLVPQSEDEEVQEIVRAMEEDQRFMADDVDGEMMRRDALRELTKSLRVRKELRERLRKTRTNTLRSHRKISFFTIFKYYLSMKLYKFQENIKIALHDNSLWQRDLKIIEGIYGSSVGSYFSFLRFLFLLNAFVSMFVIVFLLLPQMLLNENQQDSSVTSLNKASLSIYGNASTPINTSFGFLDWLTGSGWFSRTQLYYGGYSTGNLRFPESSLSYNMSQAYFFTICSCFVFYLGILLYKILVLYRANYIDAEEDPTLAFVEKVCLAWDFNITDEKSANIKRRSIYNEFIELVEDFIKDENIESFWDYLRRRIVQGIAWFILVSFFMLLCWGLYLLLKDQLHDVSFEYDGYWGRSFQLLVYPLIVTLLMVFIPMILENAGRIESYNKPRYELYVSLIRVILLGIVVLLALIIFWYENSPGLKDELKSLKQALLRPKNNEPVNVSTTINSTSVQCWENALGEEFYRLVMVDFLVIVISTLCIDTLKVILVRRGNLKPSSLRFSIARNTLHVIYNQTLLWAGLFFCPLMPLVVSIKFFVMFHLQKWSVLRNLQPNERPWRAAQTETLFHALNLFSLILAIFSNGFIVIRGYSSPSCGPFQEFTHYLDIVWNVFVNSEQFVLKAVAFFFKPGFIFCFLVFVSMCVYGLKSIAEGRTQLVSVLRKQLQMEMRDRAFLQTLSDKVTRGEHIPYPLSPGGPNASSLSVFSHVDTEPRNLTKRSSFVYSRSTSAVENTEADTSL